MQHQVAAVVVAVAEHARLGRQLLDERRELLAQRRRARVGGIDDAAIGLDEVLDEEVELPGQLLDVEGDAVGQVLGRRELGAAALQRRDERHRLPVERRVLRRRRRAEVRLQRDVAEILEREHAEVVGVAEDGRDRHRHLREQPRDVDERQRLERRTAPRSSDSTIDGASGSRTRK